MIEERRAAAARAGGTGRATLEDLYRQIQAGQTKELRVILKADVQGSLGAIRHALEQVQTDEVRINILHEGTGDITDNDILLASASDAVVVGFNTKVDPQARRTAEAEGVDVRLYDIIYQLTDEMDAALQRPARAGGGRGRRGPRRGAPDLPRRATTSSPAATSPTAASSRRRSRLSRRQARSPPIGSSRCAASVTTSARWPPATSAASASPSSTRSRRATSSSASRSRRCRASPPR